MSEDCPTPYCSACFPGLPCLGKDCAMCSRYDPPDALVVHQAAGACEPRYHRAMPSQPDRCRCGKIPAPRSDSHDTGISNQG